MKHSGLPTSATRRSWRKTFLLLASFVFLSAAANAAKWIGGASGDWDTAANWEPATVPAAGETVAFTNSAAVAVASAVTNAVSVPAGKTLSATFSAPARLSLALAAGARFEKLGSAEPAFQPVNGYYPGTVAVLAGSAAFAGNGATNAPGAFGTLEVAADATARVIESPFADRHAVLTRAVFDARAEGTKLAEFDSFAKAEAKWTVFATNGLSFTKVFRTSGVTNSFGWSSPNMAPYLPPEMQAATNKYYAFMTKAIFLVPSPMSRNWIFGDISGSSHAYLNQTRYSSDYRETTRTVTPTAAGFLPFMVGFSANNAPLPTSDRLYYLRMDTVLVNGTRENVFSDGSIWNGVCFAGLSLAEGGTLRIEDGQAAGFSFVTDPLIKGSVVAGGGSACFSMMHAYEPVDLASLKSFAGKLELGVHGKVTATNSITGAAFSLFGEGKVVAAADGFEGILPQGFDGTVVVPEGCSFASTTSLGKNVLFTGHGTVVVADGAPRPPTDFQGSVELAGAQTLDANGGELAAMSDLTLGAGATLSLGTSTVILPQGYRHDVPDWNTDGSWYLAGKSLVVDGVLVLTTNISQSAAAWHSRTFEPFDAWQVTFTYSAALPSLTGAVPGNGFAFLMQSTSTNALPAVGYGGLGLNEACNGFVFCQTAGSTKGFHWVLRNNSSSLEKVTPGQIGFDFLAPIDFTVTYVRKIMTVRMEQDGRAVELRQDFSPYFFGSINTSRRVGFAATTTSKATTGVLDQRISAFSGWLQTEVYATRSSADNRAFAVGTNNWEVFQAASFTNDNTAIQIFRAILTNGHAVCKTPIPVDRAFRFTADLVYSDFGGYYDATLCLAKPFFSTVLQNVGTNAGAMPPYNAKDGWGLPPLRTIPNLPNAVAAYFFMYEGSGLGRLGFYNNGVKTLPGALQPDTNTPKVPGTLRQYYRLDHDGASRLSLSYRKNLEDWRTAYTMPALSAETLGDEVYLMLSGRSEVRIDTNPTRTNRCESLRVENLAVNFPLNADVVFDTPIALDGDATIAVGNADTNSTLAAATFADVTLADGSTLTIAPEAGAPATRVGIGVSYGAATAIAAAADATVRLDRFVLTGDAPAVLALTGTFAFGPGGLVVVVSHDWSHGSTFKLADISGATFEGGIAPSQITFVDEEGQPLTTLSAAIHNGSIIVRANNGTLLMLQ